MIFKISDGIIIPADIYNEALKSLSCSRVYDLFGNVIGGTEGIPSYELIHALDTPSIFNRFTYRDDAGMRSCRLGIPLKISDCRNITDEFKDAYAKYRKKVNHSVADMMFDGDIVNIYKKKIRPMRISTKSNRKKKYKSSIWLYLNNT